MGARKLKLEGYGNLMIAPVNVEDKEYETVDSLGRPVTKKYVGEGKKTIYLNAEGVEIPSKSLCKKIPVDGEDLILGKFQPTKEVEKENIEVLEDPSLAYRAAKRKMYKVTTDSAELKDLIMNKHKSLQFPFTAGYGNQMWNGILMNWSGKMVIMCCISDYTELLTKYDEETVNFVVEAIPQVKDVKKLMKAMTM